MSDADTSNTLRDLPSPPKFEWGQRVRVQEDIINDGSFPGAEPEALLVAAGTVGEIVQVGTHVESNTTVYLVEFPAASGADGATGATDNSRVIGCLEAELEHA